MRAPLLSLCLLFPSSLLAQPHELQAPITLFFSYKCQPCRAMHKFLKDYAQRHQVKVDFIEVEKHPESISRYGLRATPTVFIKNEPVDLSKITSFEDFEHLLLAGPKG